MSQKEVNKAMQALLQDFYDRGGTIPPRVKQQPMRRSWYRRLLEFTTRIRNLLDT